MPRITQPGLGIKMEIRKGSADLQSFTSSLESDLRAHFPPGVQNSPPSPRSVVLVNYVRMIGGELTGHWSPIGGVWWRPSEERPDPDQTYVLIADTQATKLPPHWISLRVLVERCSSYIKRSQSYRGYVVLTAEAPPASGDEAVVGGEAPPAAGDGVVVVDGDGSVGAPDSVLIDIVPVDGNGDGGSGRSDGDVLSSVHE